MRIETVINAAVIWAAAPACSTRKNSGPRISKDRTCRNSFRIRRASRRVTVARARPLASRSRAKLSMPAMRGLLGRTSGRRTRADRLVRSWRIRGKVWV